MQHPFILVIFGATGDLTYHKLIPALFSLFKMNQLPKNFYIVGFARRDISDTDFAAMFDNQSSDPKWTEFSEHLSYHCGEFHDKNAYIKLVEKLKGFKKQEDTQLSHIFYLATPPQYYDTILGFLYDCKKDLSQEVEIHEKLAKLVIEKPFGKDLETAKLLDKKLSDFFAEWQVFRVDHYLGKETVQNMLVFRFANSIFEPIWNSEYIDHVQITLAEEKGITNRGKFFDGVGILRDVGQNHLLQLLAAVAMEQPGSFSKEGVRDARFKVISELDCIDPSKVEEVVVRGQYNGYLYEKDVDKNSKTETFVAMKVMLKSERFSGVPFYIRAGKKLAKELVTISVVFRQTCHVLFKEIGCPEEGNVLTFKIQPNEGIGIHTIVKKPGSVLSLGTVDLKFSYNDAFGTQGLDAYQKILMDIFTGDQMLFNRSDELESSWQFITNILEGWEKCGKMPIIYEEGSWGPKEAVDLIEKDGRHWIE